MCLPLPITLFPSRINRPDTIVPGGTLLTLDIVFLEYQSWSIVVELSSIINRCLVADCFNHRSCYDTNSITSCHYTVASITS